MQKREKTQKLAFSCMMGQERSVDMEDLAHKRGYETELVAGGLLTIQALITDLYNSANLPEYENIGDFIRHIKKIVANHPEILDKIELRSSHSVYFLKLLSQKDKIKRKYIVTIDSDEIPKVIEALALLRELGPVYIVEIRDLMRALVLGNLFDLLEHNQI